MKKEASKNSVYNLAIIVNIFGLIIGILVAFFLLPPQIPLFYGNLQTTAQVTSRFFYPLPMVLSLSFSLVNKIIDRQTDLFLTSICRMATLIITVFAAIAMIKIYLLVGYRTI